jgi:uncharacterized membrane protein YfcA
MTIEWLGVAVAAALAGGVDAIVGGGGLVLVPALFATFPGVAPATLLGTNKGGAVWGTAWAGVQYARRVRLDARRVAPAVLAALLGSAGGAWTVTRVDPEGLRRLLPLVLLVVLVYTLARKDFGRHHAPRLRAPAEAVAAAAIGAGAGFYDGFFGPGTGRFLVFLYVRALGHDFLHASAHAKLLNTATNASALALFAWQGHVWWALALLIAVANVAGSTIGARLALRHGAGFVRGVFVAVVGALIVKTGYDAFFR